MTETREFYIVTGTPDDSILAQEINFQLQRIADRLDKIEGVRGTPEMFASLDMNENQINDVGSPQNNADALRLGDIDLEGAQVFDSLVVLGDSQFQGDVLAEDDITIVKTSGKGIKINTANPNFGYRDITGQVTTRGVGATDPAWTQIASSVFYAYAFALNDVCWMHFHIPHDWVPGSDIALHVHWLPDGTDTNSVRWQFEYTFAKGFSQEAYNLTGTTLTAEEAGPGTAYTAMVTETADFNVSNMEIDGVLMVKITRITNGGTDNTDTIFMTTADVHYQSTNIATKNKSPDFYT